jgi:S-adenosylmethionine hydrolase
MRSAIVACCDWTDVGVAECHLTALKAATVDFHYIPVAVEKFSVINCAFLARLAAERCPPGSVIMGCVDTRAPGVPRFPIAFRVRGLNVTFLGPNTGTCSLILSDLGAEEVRRIDNADWWKFSFVGRDLLSGIAGALVSGAAIEALGPQLDVASLVTLTPPKWQALHIDNYGNIKLNARSEDLSASAYRVRDKSVRVSGPVEGKLGAVPQDADLVLVRGSSFGLLELQRRGHSPADSGAAEVLDVTIGEILEVAPA